MMANNLVCFVVPVTIVGVPYFDRNSDVYQEERLPEDHWAWTPVDMREAHIYGITLENVSDEYIASLKKHIERDISKYSAKMVADRVVLVKYLPEEQSFIVVLHFIQPPSVDLDEVSAYRSYGSSLAENMYGNQEAPILGLIDYERAIRPIATKYDLELNKYIYQQIRSNVPKAKINLITSRVNSIKRSFEDYPDGFEIAFFFCTEDVIINNKYLYQHGLK
jgi:hypothetical protein